MVQMLQPKPRCFSVGCSAEQKGLGPILRLDALHVPDAAYCIIALAEARSLAAQAVLMHKRSCMLMQSNQRLAVDVRGPNTGEYLDHLAQRLEGPQSRLLCPQQAGYLCVHSGIRDLASRRRMRDPASIPRDKCWVLALMLISARS